MSGPTNMTIGPEGLEVRQTDATRDVLTRAAKEVQKKKTTAEGDNDADVNANEFANHAHENTVPFRLLRRACDALRSSARPSEGDGPYLQDIIRSGGVHLTGPKPAPRDPKLDAILAKIRREKEDREYEEMTADVNKGGGVADDGRLKMSSLTRDLGFGAHVVTVMFACALGGWFAGAAIARGSRDDEHGHHDQSSLVVKATLAGIGALGAMFVEAALFMLRDGRT
jgi:hypothetical protein